jgi:hypothetical protein
MLDHGLVQPAHAAIHSTAKLVVVTGSVSISVSFVPMRSSLPQQVPHTGFVVEQFF